ncbi:MAG: glycosyltransferase family 39 protein [Isosphaeraceae bacterium]|nr:glycosyltransferase family 39 protein [Isosphaeraceae bacterium]
MEGVLERRIRLDGGSIAALAVLLLGLRGIDQPIWEGYIGRQVPTAMVARDLARGGDPLHPEVATGPFPNWFLVEPPIAAGVAALVSRATGSPLEVSGRLTSTLGMALAAWGLFGLVGRRSGSATAWLAVGFFAAMPVSVRFGRAFQPDALMLGLTLAGMRLRDDGRPRLGLLAVALGLATKVLGAFLLVPLVFGRDRTRDREPGSIRFDLGFAALALLPATAWYLHASSALGASAEASASAEIAATWARRLGALGGSIPMAIARDLSYRAFTPLLPPLALIGLASAGTATRMIRVWAIATAAAFAVLAGKLHHEYYWLMAAPIVAWAAAVGIVRLAENRRVVAILAGTAFAALSLVQTRAVWTTPAEWLPLSSAGRMIAESTEPSAILIAPEALIYAADRRGCRWEWEPNAVRRAAAEWRSSRSQTVVDAPGLLDFYRTEAGATHFADLQVEPLAPDRRRLHQALRAEGRHRVVIDEPGGLLLIRLAKQGPSACPTPPR